jgi:hypothetical protein
VQENQQEICSGLYEMGLRLYEMGQRTGTDGFIPSLAPSFTAYERKYPENIADSRQF